MKQTIAKVVDVLLATRAARRVTYILSPTLTVCATRRFKFDGRNRRNEVLLTIGTPNFASRQLIKRAVKGGESFPIKKLQFYPTAA